MLMKRERIHQFLYGVSILLVIGFAIRIVADYLTYDPVANSAPFSVFVLIRALIFLVPSGLIAIAATIHKKKQARSCQTSH